MSAKKIIVEGVDEQGQKFRPSDWVERLSSMGAGYGPDHRLHYSRSLHPDIMSGEKCLVIEPELEKENPTIYRYVINFVKCNHLRSYEVEA